MKIVIFTSSFNMQLNFRKKLMLDIIRNGHDLRIFSDVDEQNGPISSKKHFFHSFSNNLFFLLKDLFRYKKLIENDTELIINYTVRNCLLAAILDLIGLNRKRNIYFIAGLGRAYNESSIMSRLIVKIISNSAVNHNKLIVMNNRDLFQFKKYGVSPIKINSEGLDIKLFPFKPLIENDKYFRILFMGRVIEEKGIYDILKIADYFKNNDKVIFDIYGDTSETPRKYLDNAKNYTNIRIHGFTSDPMSEIEKSNLLILPSKLNEGLPRIMLESFAIGRICIAYNIPGCRDVYGFTKYKENFLADDIRSFILKCERLINTSQDEYNLIGSVLRDSVIEFHDITEINNKIMNDLNL